MDLTAPTGRGDVLTRTTLRLSSGPAPLAIEQVVRALQRVPGVLTVEADASGASAIVAHDAAVPLTSLVAAAGSAGAAARAVGGMREPAGSTAAAVVAKPLNRQNLRYIAIAAILAVLIIDVTFPTSPDKRWLFLAPVAAFWGFFVFRELARRPR